MKIFKYIPIILFSLVATQAAAQWTYKDFKRLKNLKGNWEAKSDKGFIQEKWERTNDTVFEGKNYKIEHGVSILDEQLKIIFNKNEILFQVTIHYKNKGLPVTYKLAKIDGDKYIFENKDYEFPQQIVYQLKSSDKLAAYVNGTTEKGFKQLDFSFYRTKR
jgi:hypothetical protein